MDDTLSFYATAAPMTALPFREYPQQLAELPRDPLAAGTVVRGVLIHRDWAPILGVEFGPERLADQHVRSMHDVVARIVELVDAPLTTERVLGDRMVGTCRDFATLHVALLRHAGVPARARCGFASYFEDGQVDHWITEWWNGERWVRTDAQLFPEATNVLSLDFDPWDQPPDAFHTAARAWQRCRAGEDDPNRYGIWTLRGLWFIAGNITLDLGALNKIELLPWDIWGTLDPGPDAPMSDEQLAHVDALAELIERDDLPALRKRFTEPDVAIPRTIISIIDDVPTPVELDPALLRV